MATLLFTGDDQHGGDELPFVAAYCLRRFVVGGEGVAEGDIIVGQPEVFASLRSSVPRDSG